MKNTKWTQGELDLMMWVEDSLIKRGIQVTVDVYEADDGTGIASLICAKTGEGIQHISKLGDSHYVLHDWEGAATEGHDMYRMLTAPWFPKGWTDLVQKTG